MVLVVIGFAFKVSAVPFHTWAPDTYEGAPTPITAFLAVLSKTAGFVALLQLILIAFSARSDVIEPLMWGLSALTMTVGNLIALRQTNIIRMLAYSGVAQAGFMLAPLAVVGSNPRGAGQAVVTYLLIYAAMNLGAFAVVLAVARKTRSAEISTWGGLFEYAPGLTVLMTMFLFSLAGIPPLGGWLAKFVVFRALLEPDVTAGGVTLAVVVGVNSVIALYYYANVAKTMWMDPVPDGDRTPVRVPFSLGAALAISITLTVAFGVSNLATRFGDLALFIPSSPHRGPPPTTPGAAADTEHRASDAGSYRRSSPGGGTRGSIALGGRRQSSSGWSRPEPLSSSSSLSSSPLWPEPLLSSSSSSPLPGPLLPLSSSPLPGPLLSSSTTPFSVRMSVSSASSRKRTRSRTWPSSISRFTCTRLEPERKSSSTSRPAPCSTSTAQPLAGVALTSRRLPPSMA